MTKSKPRKLYFLVIQSTDGKVLQVLNSYEYDMILIEGMDLARELKGYWTIVDVAGKTIDGNFNADLLKSKEGF